MAYTPKDPATKHRGRGKGLYMIPPPPNDKGKVLNEETGEIEECTRVKWIKTDDVPTIVDRLLSQGWRKA